LLLRGWATYWLFSRAPGRGTVQAILEVGRGTMAGMNRDLERTEMAQMTALNARLAVPQTLLPTEIHE
jgi:hypothetical protein